MVLGGDVGRFACHGSFGVLIHEVLTQRIPFAGKSVAKVSPVMKYCW